MRTRRGSTNNAVAQVFMNIVLDEAFEEKEGGEKVAIGMIVRRMNLWNGRTPLMVPYRSSAVTLL